MVEVTAEDACATYAGSVAVLPPEMGIPAANN